MPTTFFLFNSTQVELFFPNFEKPTVLLASFNDGAVVAPPTTIMDEAQGERLAPIKQRKVMGVTLAPWRSPLSQVILVGFVCFLCPGMFNALGGIGGGGQLDTSIQSNANTALYTTFAVFGFVAGTFLNYFGAKPTLAFGGVGYAIYAASFLCYNHTENRPFVIFAGALLGLCAALLWCAQGTVMMSYPIESEKGRYIGMFWGIFNTGAVIGSIIPIAANWNDPNALHVNDGTYIGFLVLMLAGAVLAFFLVSPDRVIRKDGTRVQRIHHPSAISEIKGLWATLKSDSYILLLFPFFWASNWFYTYQQNSYNVYMFNLRGRTFTNLWYWLAQIIGALMFGFFLDNKRMSRRTRAIAGWVILFAVVNATWGGGLKPLIGSTREKVANGQNPDLDVFDTDYTWYLILYLFYGFLDAVWQTYAYWLMGALSNEPRKLAYFAGFYKGIQSAGAAVVWSLDANKHSYYVLFGTSWGLCVVGMLFAIPVIWWRVHDTEITEMDYVRPDEKNMRVSEGEGEETRTA